MKTYTKYDLITTALNNIVEEKTKFICPTIENQLFVGAGKAFKYIPELLEYRPANTNITGAWWRCDEEGRQKRITVLIELQKRFENDKTVVFRKYEVGDKCEFYIDADVVVGEIEDIDNHNQVFSASTYMGMVNNIPIAEILSR